MPAQRPEPAPPASEMARSLARIAALAAEINGKLLPPPCPEAPAPTPVEIVPDVRPALFATSLPPREAIFKLRSPDQGGALRALIVCAPVDRSDQLVRLVVELHQLRSPLLASMPPEQLPPDPGTYHMGTQEPLPLDFASNRFVSRVGRAAVRLPPGLRLPGHPDALFASGGEVELSPCPDNENALSLLLRLRFDAGSFNVSGCVRLLPATV